MPDATTTSGEDLGNNQEVCKTGPPERIKKFGRLGFVEYQCEGSQNGIAGDLMDIHIRGMLFYVSYG